MESIGLIWDYVYSTGKLYFFFIHLALLVLGIHFIRQNVSQSERNRRVDGRKRKHNSQKFISEEKLLGTEENGNSSVKPAQFLSHVRRNDRLNEPAGYGTDWAGEVLAWLCRYPFVVDVELYKTNILSVLNRRLQRKVHLYLFT